VLERDSAEIEIISRRIFGHGRGRKPPAESHQEILRNIGRKADLTSKVRESLVSIGRLVLFLANEADVIRLPKEQRAQVKSMARDVASLTDHATFLANKIQFMLDAVLGLVQLEQNNVIKIFSVVAVVFMPPTLVASIYGMNFKHMPELDWILGYPLALLIMIGAAILPYAYFKWKRWL
jgi:magnesium transporter